MELGLLTWDGGIRMVESGYWKRGGRIQDSRWWIWDRGIRMVKSGYWKRGGGVGIEESE